MKISAKNMHIKYRATVYEVIRDTHIFSNDVLIITVPTCGG